MIMPTLRRLALSASSAAIGLYVSAGSVFAQLNAPPPIEGLPDSTPTTSDDIKSVIVRLITFVLDFLALIAVVFIIIAGIRLIISQGEEEQKDKAKKTILYVVAGLIVVLLARVIVGFFTGGAATSFLNG